MHFSQMPVTYVCLSVSKLVESFSFSERLLFKSSLKDHCLSDVAAKSVGFLGISIPKSLIGYYRLFDVLLESIIFLTDPSILTLHVDSRLKVGSQKIGVP